MMKYIHNTDLNIIKDMEQKEHYEAIEKYGITPIHRKSFLKNVL